MAEYTNFLDPASAQEIQISALNLNRGLLKPLKGTSYSKLTAPASGQASASSTFISKRFLTGNDLVIYINALLEDLRWSEEYSHRFEAAMREPGLFLGFGSQRPEHDMGKGPDNLWALGGLKYLIIECKSGATSAPKISKKDTNQLNGSITWFRQTYDESSSYIPIIVHPKTQFEPAASPDQSIRIIHEPGLKALKEAVRVFTTALATSSQFGNPKEVDRQIGQHNLDAVNIVSLASVPQSKR